MPVLALLACWASCKACNPQVNPQFETARPETGEDETADTQDSVIDTAPPPLCEQVEEEPNNKQDEATPIRREAEACGEFTGGLDLDYYLFETRGAGWLEIDVDAGERGSSADVNLSLESEGGYRLTMQDGAGSADPYVLVPVAGEDSWYLTLNEERVQGDEEGFEYFFHVSEAKAPMTFDRVEAEDNDDWTTAEDLPIGEVIYGVIDDTSDRDWFKVTTPSAKGSLRVEVVAHRKGSPLDARMFLWKETKEGELADEAEEMFETNPFDVGLDPAFERTGGGNEVWYLQVLRLEGGAGPLYWYTLSVTEVSE